MRWIFVAAALIGCTVTPVRPLPPPDGPGDCSSACANIDRLGCGIGPECVPHCEDAARAEGELGIRFPVGCLTAARSCDEAARCE